MPIAHIRVGWDVGCCFSTLVLLKSKRRTRLAKEEISCAALQFFSSSKAYSCIELPVIRTPNSSSTTYQCHVKQANFHLLLRLHQMSLPPLGLLWSIPYLFFHSLFYFAIAVTILHCNYFSHLLLHAQFPKHRNHKCLVHRWIPEFLTCGKFSIFIREVGERPRLYSLLERCNMLTETGFLLRSSFGLPYDFGRVIYLWVFVSLSSRMIIPLCIACIFIVLKR